MYFHGIKKLLPAIIKMLTQYITNIPALCLHGMQHEIFYHWHTATATCTGFCTFFYGLNCFTLPFGNNITDRSFADTFATAYQCIIGKAEYTCTSLIVSASCAENKIFG